MANRNRIIEPEASPADEAHDRAIRLTSEYAEGRAAFHASLDMDACPHSSRAGGMNQQRYCWFVGWLDARTEARVCAVSG